MMRNWHCDESWILPSVTPGGFILCGNRRLSHLDLRSKCYPLVQVPMPGCHVLFFSKEKTCSLEEEYFCSPLGWDASAL